VPRLLRYAVVLPWALAQAPPPDLLHCAVHAPLPSPFPLVYQLHDASFRRHPEYFPNTTRWRLNLLVPLHLRSARQVTTISEFSRRDVAAALGVRPERIRVVPGAVTVVAPRPDVANATLARLRLDRPYVLYLGNLHPRKNVARLIDAFTRARGMTPGLKRHQLVIAGARWWGGGEEAEATRRAPAGAVRWLGLLATAQALAYPSLFEGFGLPPLEAMAVGTPVLASNVTAMPEVLDDAALLVDPLDVDAMADGLTRLLADGALVAELRRRGLERALRFSPRSCGEAALDAFRAAMENT
jgi:glycosyltransferase involved in cell wall biosynthesis